MISLEEYNHLKQKILNKTDTSEDCRKVILSPYFEQDRELKTVLEKRHQKLKPKYVLNSLQIQKIRKMQKANRQRNFKNKITRTKEERKLEQDKKKLSTRRKKVLAILARKLKICLREQRLYEEKIERKKTEHERRSDSASIKHDSNAPDSSKYRGVYFNKVSNKYKASIKHKQKKIHIGMFSDEIEAAKAYDSKAKELHGLKATLNFPG